MNKEIAKELDSFVETIAQRYSRTDRIGNYNSESFKVQEVIPTSDHTAVVYFKKSSGKIGLGFFYYIARGASQGWKYFFPTDSHINGFRAFEFYKLLIERDNFKHNFK
jgi:hypothetical protein